MASNQFNKFSESIWKIQQDTAFFFFLHQVCHILLNFKEGLENLTYE